MKYLFNTAQVNYIIKEYLDNKKSLVDISKKFNCSTTPIIRVLKENNIKIKNNKHHPILTKSQIKSLISDYEKCKNLGILAKKYNQTNIAISKLLKENNIKVVNLFSTPKINEKYWDDIVDMYQKGNSLTSISKLYCVGHHCISRILKKKNIKVINRQNFPRMNEHIFTKVDNEEKAYWLGFIYADGYISKGEFGVALSIKDENHILKLKKFLNYTGNIRYRSDTKSCSLVFRNKNIILDLQKLGVCERKSKILVFPNEKQVPKRFLRHFIRGYIDGDGSVYYNKNGLARLSIIGTYSMLNGIINTLNFEKRKITKANKNGCDEVKEISWTGDYVYKYLKLIYDNSTISLDRKKEKLLEIKNFRRKRLNEMKTNKNNKVKYKKAVIQLDNTGNIIKRWKHLDDASNKLNIRTSYIIRVCNKVRIHTGGFRWEYDE